MSETAKVIDLQPAAAPRAKTDEECVLEDLGEIDGRTALAICDELAAEAKGLHDIAGEITGKNGSNAARQFYRWRVRCAALSRIYARAMASRAHVIAQRAWQEIEDEPDAQKARVKLDAIKWLAAKFNRAEFGDEPTGAGVNVTINNDAGAAVLDELRQRLARKRKSMLTVGGEGVRDEREGPDGSAPTLTLPSRT